MQRPTRTPPPIVLKPIPTVRTRPKTASDCRSEWLATTLIWGSTCADSTTLISANCERLALNTSPGKTARSRGSSSLTIGVAYRLGLVLLVVAIGWIVAAPSLGEPWIADQGDGTFKNPVLFADYSDPDVVRVGDDFYMTASSFSCVPGLPILHSRDLVNWKIIGYAIERLPERFDTVQPGNGIWAPSLRHHDGHFWIFVSDPDVGILMTRAEDPAGPWEPLHTVKAGKGLIDPCPLWDGDKAYLVHALAKSRSGRSSLVVGYEMSLDGRRLIGDERVLIDGRAGAYPTIEGPKFYKRGGWYYIFAPAGGVKPGWQLAARAKSPFGPYEVKRVLEQGQTKINGPHQGGWVELKNGENWFVHFQDRGAYGRVVHLNPVKWVDGWPAMGADQDGNGVGEPISVGKKPDVGKEYRIEVPQASDEFDNRLGLTWQWQANPQAGWASLTDQPGQLRLYAAPLPSGNLAAAGNALLQKFSAPSFTATTLLTELADRGDSRAGLIVMGQSYAGLMVNRNDHRLRLEQVRNRRAQAGGKEGVDATVSGLEAPLWLRVEVEPEARCTFFYSTDGQSFQRIGKQFVATPGRWIGAKLGIVCVGEEGFADFDWFRVQ
jgi:beta-xylosidase